ncbi:hypothetical protein BKI52_30435 [marine bacterium AO1-C]|nr:hypothetical protein BKI52_30435 [marine bacterium AO1-C]
MIYAQQQAHPDLRDCVRCYWKLENNTQQPLHYTIMPDGFFDLLICYHKNNLEKVFLTGLWTKKVNVVILPNTTLLGVQFRLLAIEHLIQKSIAPVLNDMMTMEKTFWGLDTFAQQVDSFSFEHLDRYLLPFMKEKDSIDSRKFNLLNLINQTQGNQTIEDYSKQVFWTKRQINRYFQSTFGLSLKSYCTIRKSAASYSHIKKGQLYPEHNYFDQSHFIKTIKRITGHTPKELTRNENDRFLQFSIIESE